MTTVQHISPFLPIERAWICAKFGWRVMPLRRDTKLPAIKDWPNLATTDIYQIDEWFHGSFASCEIGILTGPNEEVPDDGIWMLDIDVKWCNGFATLRDLFKKHGVTEIPNTFRVKSPSGGQHWFFKYPVSGKKIRNVNSEPDRPGPLGPELEVRGWHGQAVAPLGLGRDVINDARPIYAPDWLEEIVTRVPTPAKHIETVTSQSGALQVLRAMASKLSVQPVGRNPTLNIMSFQLGLLGARGLLDVVDARAALHEACVSNGAIGDGPDTWSNGGEGQFDATFTSGWTAGLAEGAHK